MKMLAVRKFLYHADPRAWVDISPRSPIEMNGANPAPVGGALVYTEDASLTLEWGSHGRSSIPPWTRDLAMTEVELEWSHVKWNGNVIDRYEQCLIDAGAGRIPAPLAAAYRDEDDAEQVAHFVTAVEVSVCEVVNSFDARSMSVVDALRTVGVDVVDLSSRNYELTYLGDGAGR